MNRTIMLGFVVVLGTASAWGQERISVNRLDSTCGICQGGSGTVDINQAASGSTSIPINNSNALSPCTMRIRVYPNPNDSITTVKSLSIDGGSACEPFQIILGQSIFPNPDSEPQKIDANWRGMSLSTSAPDSVFYGGCTGDLIGTITGVNKIARFDCDGAVTRNINAIEGINGRGVVLQAGSFTDTCTVSIGKIEDIVSDGDLRADIITTLVTGDILAGGGQGTGIIQATTIIGNVTFGGGLNRIDATAANGEVRGIVTASVFGTAGSDLSPLAVRTFRGGADILTDVLSPIEILDDWETLLYRRIRIGGSLKARTDSTGALPVGNRMIVLYDPNTGDGQVTNGLSNPVVINAENHTPTQDLNGDGQVTTADFWLGDVSIDFPGQGNLGTDRFAPALDEVLLGPDQPGAFAAPYYTVLSHTFGGGAVGVAPFNFHQFTGPAPASRADLDCNPYHTETVRVGDCEDITDLAEVIIDHYGPIYVNGAGPHFRVEYRPDFLPASWSDVTGQFETDMGVGKTPTAEGSNKRRAFLRPTSTNTTHFNSSGLFRVRPIAGKVKCGRVSGNPDVAYDSSITSGDLGSTSGTQYDWYQFRVRLSLCDGMTVFEGGRVNAADIAAWSDDPFEVNRDGRADARDLAAMMDAYNP